jgi:DNA primase
MSGRPRKRYRKMTITDIKQLRAPQFMEQTIAFLKKEYGMDFSENHKGQYSSLCPFHNEAERSFKSYINDDGLVTFKCFGACNKNYDVFNVMELKEKENTGRKHSMLDMAIKFGGSLGVKVRLKKRGDKIEAQDTEPALAKETKKLQPKHYEALEFVAEYSHRLLLSSLDPKSKNYGKFKNVFRYLAKRGVTLDDIKTYRIGFCPAYADLDYRGRAVVVGYEEIYGNFSVLRELGLTSPSTYEFNDIRLDFNAYELGAVGRYWDTMRGRLIFPIIMNGKVEAFQTRLPKKSKKEPRWCWSSMADTGRLFYGWDQAAGNIKRHKMVIIAEGIFDYFALVTAIGCQSNNIVLCTLGAKFTQAHAAKLESLGVEHYIFAYDNDETGREGLKRALSVSNGHIFKLLVPLEDPSVSFSEGVPFLQGMDSLKFHLDRRAKKIAPPVLEMYARNKVFEIEPVYKEAHNIITEQGQEDLALPAPEPRLKSTTLHYPISEAMTRIRYKRSNGNGKRKKLELVEAFLNRPGQKEEDTFSLPAWFVRKGAYKELADTLPVFLFLIIVQGRIKRYISQSDGTLAAELGLTRQTFNRYKRELEAKGFLCFINPERTKYKIKCIPTRSL